MGTRRALVLAGVALGLIVALGLWLAPARDQHRWTEAELRLLRSLSLASLPVLPANPSNRYADDPAAAALGHRLFFDARMSGSGRVACSTCHQPERLFTDGLPVSMGMERTTRNAMTLVGAAYSPFYFWDGRKDSLWSQALAPMESGAEHGGNRMQAARLAGEDSGYRRAYEALFGSLPDFSDRARYPMEASPFGDASQQAAWNGMTADDRDEVTRVFVNLGKSLEAYERLLMPGASRFDRYVASLPDGADSQGLTAQERAGLRLFIGEAGCVNCHNGPLFSNFSFHNTAPLPPRGMLPSKGRSDAISDLLSDPFNCRGAFSDAGAGECPELDYLRTGDELMGAQRTPTLRNVAETAPYLHAGQLATLSEVLLHYNEAPQALIGHNETKPLGLSQRELVALEAFLHTLSAPVAVDAEWLRVPRPDDQARSSPSASVRSASPPPRKTGQPSPTSTASTLGSSDR